MAHFEAREGSDKKVSCLSTSTTRWLFLLYVYAFSNCDMLGS